MSDRLKQQIAECYRRAEEHRRLYHRCLNLNEREKCFLATMQLTRLAKDLESRLREKDRDELEAQV
jgi:hypothetical protein